MQKEEAGTEWTCGVGKHLGGGGVVGWKEVCSLAVIKGVDTNSPVLEYESLTNSHSWVGLQIDSACACKRMCVHA